jgi:RNA polymerase sigma-70 factor (ECF subfamily)
MSSLSFNNSLYIEHRFSLKQYLMRYLFSPDDAEDITQEAYIKVFKVIESDRVEHPKALLYKTASNLAIDHLRKHARTSQLNDSFDTQEELSTQQTSPEDKLSAQQTFNLMCDAVVELPPKCRQVFILHRFYNKKYSEIAEELEISVNTVQRHMIKALKHCRQRWQQLDHDGKNE